MIFYQFFPNSINLIFYINYLIKITFKFEISLQLLNKIKTNNLSIQGLKAMNDLIKQLSGSKFPSLNSIDFLRKIQEKILAQKATLTKTQPSIQNLIALLIELSCQNKNHLHHQKSQDKHIGQKCLAYIQQILFHITRNSEVYKQKITQNFIEHIISHPSCYVSYLLFYKINKRSNSQLIKYLGYEYLKKLNIKIIAHFEEVANQISTLHSLSKNSSFKKCQQNLQQYLLSQERPLYSTKNPQQKIRPSKTKIPPLLLPTSKSISSSRYSYSNQQTAKKKGLTQLTKLAQSLGEGFVSVQLGILIGNKRTQQVNQFTQNSEFREKCIEKLQTERASSRLSFIDGFLAPNDFSNDPEQQKNQKNFINVLIINGNLLVEKLEKQESQYEPFLRQYLDIGFTNLTKFSCLKLRNDKVQFTQHEGQIKTVLYSLQKVLSILMNKCAQKSQLSNLAQLMNRNKENSSYHYNPQKHQHLIKDQLLQDIQAIKLSSLKPSKGPLIQQNFQKHIYEDFVVQYICHYMKQIIATCDLTKQKSQTFQIKILKLLGFYLNETTSNTTKYLIIDKVFPFLILMKRQMLELSHPHLNTEIFFDQNKNYGNTYQKEKQKPKPLIYRQPELFANFLIVISKLMTNNKHSQRLFSSTFLKNIYFMETVQNFANFAFSNNLINSSLSVLEFFKTTLKIYEDRRNRNNQSKTLSTIFQNVFQLINSNQGCIVKTIKKLQYLINPNKTSSIQDNKMHYFLQQTMKFISEVYYYCDIDTSNLLIEQQTAGFYVKFSMVNFVKLYSSLTVTQLINTHAQSKQILTATKSSPHYTVGSNVNQDYMIIFLRIMSNISINRTNQISKKIRQYRVLEFFIRQLQLQFSVNDNIEKYIKKAKKNKDVPKKFYTEISEKSESIVQKDKKIKIPSLKLNGDSQNQKQQDADKLKSKKNSFKIPSLKIPVKNQEKEDKNRSQNKSDKGVFLQLTKLNLGTNQSERQGSRGAKTSQRNVIYYEQRKVRKIYSSKTLHAECLLLVLSLVLQKGLLDAYYCDQFPITHGKTNILYILHHHLNHQSNRSIIPLVGQMVSKIKPYLSGQRLLKLLTNSFTQLSNYKNWKKINSGAYGVIYSCQTNISQPKEVAIKEMNFPKSIYERCVLHDIFTEITCLENFRLDDRITKMYNYGVVDNTYVIVMKKYNCSLREWVLRHKNELWTHLNTILTIYYDVLKIVKTLHDQKVTHYDIKADNILLEIDPDDQNKIKAVFGDFGQCKIYESEHEELDMKSRGTECIKSPQMLTLALQSKKEADHYDRRKKIGTTRASDIWSLGCLFYQILTGQFLFHRADWVNFYVHVTSHNQELLTQENIEKLNHNTLLVEFLRFMLIRDPNHRPSIANLIDKYDHLYALFVNIPPNKQKDVLKSPLQFNQTLDNLLLSYMKQISRKNDNFQTQENGNQSSVYSLSKRSLNYKKLKSSGYLMKIMNDIYYCDNQAYFISNPQKFKKQGITHVIASQPTSHFLNVFVVKQLKKNDFYTTMSLAFKLCPRISDILRQVLLVKGKLLFVNNQTNYAVNLLIYTLSYWFRCSVYETWCLINTQILLFPALNSHLIKLSSSLQILNKIQNHVESLPKLQCICGSVTMILKKKITQKKGQFRSCKCKSKCLYEFSNNSSSTSSQSSIDCPSLGCSNYLDFLKKRYSIYWDSVKWVLTNQSYFLTTLFKHQSSKDKKQTIKDALRTEIILNSAEPYQNMINSGSSVKGWKQYQCKVCQMWILASNDQGQIWVVMNNLIRRSRQGIMIPNAQQDFKMRTPALNFYTLSKLHMTSQSGM